MLAKTMLPNVHTTCEHKKVWNGYGTEGMQFAEVNIAIESKVVSHVPITLS
jgi:hypothetical protein